MAARSAGMYSVAVIDGRYLSPADFLGDAKPDLLVNSLDELSVQRLVELAR